MQVSFRKSKGTLLHFGKNEDRDTYTLNIETEEGVESYPMLSEEEISEIEMECNGFSTEEDFICDKFLPIKEMQSTVKDPLVYYCKECYRRGLDMEYEAMGLR